MDAASLLRAISHRARLVVVIRLALWTRRAHSVTLLAAHVVMTELTASGCTVEPQLIRQEASCIALVCEAFKRRKTKAAAIAMLTRLWNDPATLWDLPFALVTSYELCFNREEVRSFAYEVDSHLVPIINPITHIRKLPRDFRRQYEKIGRHETLLTEAVSQFASKALSNLFVV